ncbi:heavy metal translocating P-type ATPase [Sphaerobacter thermophilus]|uniref:Heavy metal translocating P-type ATPase n=1 Tax=Sphaerobacter thermophilus (strain ATCC 49802 / DSM 20745 / KCCM 41009 / NCIMB 13125 / S 6022) TaxID=479434 RepID=D1C993_SPHTD|nr:heavy metal translocating P-type ATPase [Sphaerobacter thermophilus]ACZ40386.1 heavy metal translocating P-type ATPase [Sphaerobacter thermophilus DSM 20745]
MTQTIHLAISGRTPIHCAGCEQRIGNALRRLPGVASVQASQETQQVRVAFDPEQVSVEQIRARLARAGFETAPAGGGCMSARAPARPGGRGHVERGTPGAAQQKLLLSVGGMHCSLCTESIRRAIGRLDGVQSVQVSIAHEEALVEYDPARVTPEIITEALEDIGYTVREPDQAERFAEEERDLAVARRKAVLSIGLLVAASAVMLTTVWLGPSLERTLAMGALALFTAGGPARFIIVRNGWQSIRRGILNQDVLVTASALGGLLGGLVGLVVPAVPAGGFFGATVFVLAFHLIGGYASVLVHVRASQSVRRLLALTPETAHRLTADGREEVVPVAQLAVGDRVRVRPGERIPADGVVLDGASAVDESLVTGEPIPVDKLPGSEVIGGSLNQAGSLIIRVSRVGAESFLQTVARQVAEARALKPGILRLVDQVLVVYVPAVFAASAAGLLIWTVGAWLLAGAPDLLRGGFAALSVLIMGYPCALGMSTPLAIIRASGEAAERGILMRSGEAFHVFRSVRTIVFDKTGTLTEGKPQLVACLSPLAATDRLLHLAASAETLSEHPLARAIVAEAHARGLTLETPTEFAAWPGRGVAATVAGHRLLVGTERFLAEENVNLAPLASLVEQVHARGQTAVLVAVDGRAAGVLALADRAKPDARATVERLRRLGMKPVLLTGDNWHAARAVAAAAGIDEVLAEVLPGDKAAEIRRLQAQGQRVAMVGDGINDAPALMQADVGIAIGAGTDVTLEAADVVLVSERLETLVEARELARRSYQLTVTNVGLALAFNGIGVIAAITGLVAPVWAMVAMAASVSVVLGNSFAGRLGHGRAREWRGE